MMKPLFAIVLIALVGVPFANSLSCYSCGSKQECENPRVTQCTNATADATSLLLSFMHNNLTIVEGSQSFECAKIDYFYAANNTKANQISGCVHPAIQTCTLGLRSTDYRYKCFTCVTDQCNPAGTFSGSSFTIFASIVGVILAKVFQ